MLQDIIQDKNAGIVLRMFLENQLAAILKFPSYKIIAHSESLSPGFVHINSRPNEIFHDMARFSQQLAQDAHNFRINKQTSNWLVLFKRHSLSSLELFHLRDVPIIHNNKLVGILCLFNEISLNDLWLMNKFFDKNVLSTRVINKENKNYPGNLSTLEREILLFHALNKNNKQIADLENGLGIRAVNYNTIRTTVSKRIYKKLDTETIDEAIMKGISSHQIDTIPESILAKSLRDYYLIDVNDECFII